VGLSNIANETFGDISGKTQFFRPTFKGDVYNAHWLKKTTMMTLQDGVKCSMTGLSTDVMTQLTPALDGGTD